MSKYLTFYSAQWTMCWLKNCTRPRVRRTTWPTLSSSCIGTWVISASLPLQYKSSRSLVSSKGFNLQNYLMETRGFKWSLCSPFATTGNLELLVRNWAAQQLCVTFAMIPLTLVAASPSQLPMWASARPSCAVMESRCRCHCFTMWGLRRNIAESDSTGLSSLR